MMRFLLSLLVLAATQISAAWAEDWRTGQFILPDWDGPALRVFYVEPPEGRQAGVRVESVVELVAKLRDEAKVI